MQRLQSTRTVDGLPRSGRPRKATPREHRVIAPCARKNRFATSACIRDKLNFWCHASIMTVNIRLNEQRLSCKATHKTATTAITSSAGSMELVM